MAQTGETKEVQKYKSIHLKLHIHVILTQINIKQRQEERKYNSIIRTNTSTWGTNALLKGIEYNSSTKGKCTNDEEILAINCESEKWNTEVEKDKKSIFWQCDKCGMNLRFNLRL